MGKNSFLSLKQMKKWLLVKCSICSKMGNIKEFILESDALNWQALMLRRALSGK